MLLTLHEMLFTAKLYNFPINHLYTEGIFMSESMEAAQKYLQVKRVLMSNK